MRRGHHAIAGSTRGSGLPPEVLLQLYGAFKCATTSEAPPPAGFLSSFSRDGAKRGSQASFTHHDGFPIMQALIARGVIGDFRAPDILRFGFTPLYTSHVDVWDAVEILRGILTTGIWDRPEFRKRGAVT